MGLISKIVDRLSPEAILPPQKVKKTRRANDVYPTPSLVTQALLDRYPFISGRVLEPCAGTGDMSNVLKAHPGVEVVTNDLLTEMPTDRHFDARRDEAYDGVEADWIVSNPPFSAALEIIGQSYRHCKVGCAFLTRLSFLEPTIERGQWLSEHAPTCCIVMPRISFTGDKKTDNMTVCWLIWDTQDRSVPVLQFVPKSYLKGKSDESKTQLAPVQT